MRVLFVRICTEINIRPTRLYIDDEQGKKMWQQGHRRRRGRRGRYPKPVRLGMIPQTRGFTPNPQSSLEPVYIDRAELEAFRLVDLEGLSQAEAGQRMGVSRGTVWRLLQSVRKKAALALTEGRTLHVGQKLNNV